MKNNFKKLLFYLILMLAFISCKEPSEDERLKKFHGSIKFKAYQLTSEKVTKIAVIEYNKKNNPPTNEHLVHSTLGILYFLLGKSEFSYMEAETISKGSKENDKALSLGLKTIALSKMKYPVMSKSAYEDLKIIMANQKNSDVKTVDAENKVLLFSLIIVGLYQGDPDLTKYGADALGAISEVDYLPPLVGVMVEVKKGSPFKALEQLNELNKSERFSEHKKKFFTEVADIISKSSDKDKIGDEIVDLIQTKVLQRILDDIFTSENKLPLLEKAKTLPDLISGKTNEQN